MKNFFGLMIFALMIFSAKCFAAAPPSSYEVWDRIPYEDVLEKNFTANANFDLYDEPRSKIPVFMVFDGEVLKRVSSVVYANPAAHKVKVLRKTFVSSSPDGDTDVILYDGDEVYLIMHTGEGTFMGWHEGQIFWQFDSDMNYFYGTHTSRKAWGEYQGIPTDANLGVERWDCFQNSNGQIGWALVQKNGKELDYFTGENIF